MAAIGVVIGLVGARFLAHAMQGVLFEIEATDVVTFVEVAGVLLGAATLASWLPARRALRIDPVSALRSD